MASFGEEPGNAARGSAQWPTKSALCGLVGAALGVLREDRDGQTALANDYRFVVRAERRGTLLRDTSRFRRQRGSPPHAPRPCASPMIWSRRSHGGIIGAMSATGSRCAPS